MFDGHGFVLVARQWVPLVFPTLVRNGTQVQHDVTHFFSVGTRLGLKLIVLFVEYLVVFEVENMCKIPDNWKFILHVTSYFKRKPIWRDHI